MTGEVKAESWALYELEDFCFVRGKNPTTKKQIASLTKMFTLAVCLQLETMLRLDRRTLFRIHEDFPTGTTASLQKGCFMSLEDLYHGMMLPSGNDASLVLATYFGWFMVKPPIVPTSWQEATSPPRRFDVSENEQHYTLCLSKFLHEMNRLAKQLNL